MIQGLLLFAVLGAETLTTNTLRLGSARKEVA
jgi:hypothetical protein